MKLYVCVTPFFPSQNRWQGAYVLDQVKAIQRNSDYRVVVFKTNGLFQRESDYEIDGLKVHVIRPLLMPSYFLNGLTEGLVGRLFVNTLLKYGYKCEDVAVVHCHTANHSAFGFGIKQVNPSVRVVIQFHDLDPYSLCNGWLAHKSWNVQYRANKSLSAFNRADLLVCISTPVKESLLAFPKARNCEVYSKYLQRISCLGGYEKRLINTNVYVLYNGVDTTVFYPAVRENDAFFRIGCIANFQILKDHITLIKAFEILHKKGYSNIVMALIGNGETKQMCYDYLERNNLLDYIEWHDEVEHSKLPAFYHSLDLFVLPSVYEGFGCVYTEAYACGIPYIGVFNQGAAELIAPDERDMWLIYPHDYCQLAGLIEHYYKTREPQTLINTYNIDKLIIDFLKHIETL